LRLFDTSFLIDLVEGDEGAAKKAEDVDAEALFKGISVVGTDHRNLLAPLFNR